MKYNADRVDVNLDAVDAILVAGVWYEIEPDDDTYLVFVGNPRFHRAGDSHFTRDDETWVEIFQRGTGAQMVFPMSAVQGWRCAMSSPREESETS